MPIKVAVFPSFSMEVLVSTFLPKEKFQIVPLELRQGRTEKYGTQMYGEWCYPLKLFVAMFERAIKEEGVQKLFIYRLPFCKYPLVMGNLKQWIDADFDAYCISMEQFTASFDTVVDFFTQLKKADKDFSVIRDRKKIGLAIKKIRIASEMKNFYLDSLPRVRNPAFYAKMFKTYKNRFLAENDFNSVFEEFRKVTVIERNTKFRFIVTGDLTTVIVGFPFFDLEMFLAKHGARTVSNWPMSTFHYKLSDHMKLAREVMAKSLSVDGSEKVVKYHLVEAITLAEILKEKDHVDGIIFIRPIMCPVCDNLSFILKKEGAFGLPMVEISYDEHSGVNGMVTRLEAFINIVAEKKG